VTNAAHSVETVFSLNIYETTFRFMAGSRPEAFHPSDAKKKKRKNKEPAVVGVVIVPVGVHLCQEQTVSAII
jgi:hypothetical protein